MSVYDCPGCEEKEKTDFEGFCEICKTYIKTEYGKFGITRYEVEDDSPIKRPVKINKINGIPSAEFEFPKFYYSILPKMIEEENKIIDNWLRKNGVTLENIHEYALLNEPTRDFNFGKRYSEIYHLGKPKIENPYHISHYEIISTLEIKK